MFKFSSNFLASYTIAAILGSLLFASTASAEIYYRWVDKDGSTKYTLNPPAKGQGTIIRRVYVDGTPLPISNTPTTNLNGQPNSAENQQTQNGQAVGQVAPNVNSTAVNSTVTPTPAQAITPPPANRLIVPSQDQSRPVFDNQR